MIEITWFFSGPNYMTKCCCDWPKSVLQFAGPSWVSYEKVYCNAFIKDLKQPKLVIKIAVDLKQSEKFFVAVCFKKYEFFYDDFGLYCRSWISGGRYPRFSCNLIANIWAIFDRGSQSSLPKQSRQRVKTIFSNKNRTKHPTTCLK